MAETELVQIDRRSAAESSHRCGGFCCESFYVYLRPAALAERYLAAKTRLAAGEQLSDSEREAIYICDMLVRIDEDDENSPRYTCTHFRPDTGLCGAYDARPAMCRDYPGYGRAEHCSHCGFQNPSCQDLSCQPKTEVAA